MALLQWMTDDEIAKGLEIARLLLETENPSDGDGPGPSVFPRRMRGI